MCSLVVNSSATAHMRSVRRAATTLKQKTLRFALKRYSALQHLKQYHKNVTVSITFYVILDTCTACALFITVLASCLLQFVAIHALLQLLLYMYASTYCSFQFSVYPLLVHSAASLTSETIPCYIGCVCYAGTAVYITTFVCAYAVISLCLVHLCQDLQAPLLAVSAACTSSASMQRS
jgi:hypothetical protein